MGRDYKNHHHHHKDKRHFKKNFSGHQKKPHQQNNDWQTDERLLENDVGITKYISEVEGFHGIIKSRFSDFHVNEIDLDGNLAILSDFSIPEYVEPIEEVDESLKISDFLTEDEIKQIEDLIAKEDYHKSVLIEVTDKDKEMRGNLHKMLRKVYNKKTTSNTISTGTGKKYIQVKKFGKGDKSELRGWQWPEDYVYFIMYKENVDTLQAISMLSKNLKVLPSILNYAGTKDKRAKTAQWISAKRVDPSKICEAAKRSQGVRVGNFKFKNKTLRLGELRGNRFQIALRSVTASENQINSALKSIGEFGFINYYGLQRFGNCASVPTYEVGKALLKSDFKQAVDLILKERTGEPPFMTKMRTCWKETNDAYEALKCIDRQRSTFVEAKLLKALSESRDKKYNYLQALLTLPRNMLLLYIHSYQSLIYNQVASKRRELGLNVVEGDLIFKEPNQVNDIEVLVEEKIHDESEVSEEKEETTENEEKDEKESKFKEMVRPLSKEDVESGKYNIFDIVLVMPGHDITFPSGVIGELYKELLEKDDLSAEKLKSKHKQFSLGGAYRKVFMKPRDLAWKIMKYDEPNEDLILSDYSRMRNDPEIEGKATGAHKALVLDFKLPQSTYATMLLRELLKSDTSTATQIKLQNAAKESNKTEVPVSKSDAGKDEDKEDLKRKADEEADENEECKKSKIEQE